MKDAAPHRLDADRLETLPRGIRRPGFDRRALSVQAVHIGIGAFHRCHQADYFDDLAEAGSGAGYVGINLVGPQISPVLMPQDGLFSRSLIEGDRFETRVIGSLLEVVDYSHDPERCLSLLADGAVTTVTMTLTEKGYCHIPATGEADLTHPGLLHDISAQPGAMRTAPGLLVAALALRRAARGGPINLVSCDNIAGNGAVLRRVVLATAAAKDPALAEWIAQNVGFPSTMVDRIVPASTPELLEDVAGRLGLRDAAAVAGEPFRQWVIEDSFTAPRPNWEDAGVQIVADVQGHEFIKMRVLNAAQSALSILGALQGCAASADAVRDADLEAFARCVLRQETLPYLPVVPGMEPEAYLETSLSRIANRALRHSCQQIATDTSQKIRQRILDPLRACRAAGTGAAGLETVVAAWVLYLARGQKEFGGSWQVSDPVAQEASAIAARSGGDLSAFVRGVLSLETVFGGDLAADSALIGRIIQRTADLAAGRSPLQVAGYKA